MHTTAQRVRRVLKDVLSTATPSLRDLAESAGIGYHAIRQYQHGKRTPSAAALRRLSVALTQQARSLNTSVTELMSLAAKLEAEEREKAR